MSWDFIVRLRERGYFLNVELKGAFEFFFRWKRKMRIGRDLNFRCYSAFSDFLRIEMLIEVYDLIRTECIYIFKWKTCFHILFFLMMKEGRNQNFSIAEIESYWQQSWVRSGSRSTFFTAAILFPPPHLLITPSSWKVIASRYNFRRSYRHFDHFNARIYHLLKQTHLVHM